MNEEPFWHSSFINTLHVRAAYGESGRAPGVFSALRTYSPIQGPLGLNAITANAFGNPDLKPERGKEVELGFEAQLFKRLDLDFTYYNKHTINEIVQQPLAPSTGFPGTQFANVGQVNNHGIELQASFAAITRPNFKWEITGNIATAKNKIVSLGDLPNVIGVGQNNIVGYSIASYFARKVVSADRDPKTGGATNIMCDGGPGNGPVSCDAAPLVYVGQPTPTLTGAVATRSTSASDCVSYALGRFPSREQAVQLRRRGALRRRAGHRLMRGRLQAREILADLSRRARMRALASGGRNDQFIQDDGFAKLREISQPTRFRNSFIPGVTTASFTLAARELHTWTHYRGPDPEINYNASNGNVIRWPADQNFDQGILPPLSRITASLNITF